MLDNLRVQSNSSISDSTIEETASMAYPDRPGQPDCTYYLRTGRCGYGDNCKFNHPSHYRKDNQHGGNLPERDGEPDCLYFLKTGSCKYGSGCKYNHPKDKNDAGSVALNTDGLPMRQEQKSCPHYLRTGSCRFGIACKFHHPQPTPYGPDPSVSKPAPTGAPLYTGGAPAWPYVGSQAYLPIILPSPGPTRGWVPYNGNMSQIFSTNGLTSVDYVNPSTPSSHLPIRPGEPKCRFFMNNGTCKFGSGCKYHHPVEKLVQSSASSLGPLGLPLRPGKPVCLYYSVYGVCIYGPGCKYDHPLVVYSYSYIPGLTTSQPVDDTSLASCGGMNLSDSSSSKSLKNRKWIRKVDSNGKCTDESSGECVGSSRSSSHDQSD